MRPDRVHWQRNAYCVKIDPEALTPQAGQRRADCVARHLCRACPVQPTCLGWALVTDAAEGVRGGTSPVQRRRLRTDLVRQLAGRPIAGSPELAAVVRAHSEQQRDRTPTRHDVDTRAGRGHQERPVSG